MGVFLVPRPLRCCRGRGTQHDYCILRVPEEDERDNWVQSLEEAKTLQIQTPSRRESTTEDRQISRPPGFVLGGATPLRAATLAGKKPRAPAFSGGRAGEHSRPRHTHTHAHTHTPQPLLPVGRVDSRIYEAPS